MDAEKQKNGKPCLGDRSLRHFSGGEYVKPNESEICYEFALQCQSCANYSNGKPLNFCTISEKVFLPMLRAGFRGHQKDSEMGISGNLLCAKWESVAARRRINRSRDFLLTSYQIYPTLPVLLWL
ncbi:hypothetical protein CEXT_302561 [Caerostris extrusa]|uniref:Uncharacterized protein n=1 Tax=Caerostris extrusa TaxID=172846 RepID=A0AAV4VEA3_CAEEX|nr:hypothetical protein CEXT_302561 [Caerostris extrusa]